MAFETLKKALSRAGVAQLTENDIVIPPMYLDEHKTGILANPEKWLDGVLARYL